MIGPVFYISNLSLLLCLNVADLSLILLFGPNLLDKVSASTGMNHVILPSLGPSATFRNQEFKRSLGVQPWVAFSRGSSFGEEMRTM